MQTSQKAAFGHLCDLGLKGAAEEKGLAWIIIRTCGELYAPLVGDITVTTWPGKTRTGMMPRYCHFYDSEGRLLCKLLSVWALADVQSRSMRLDAELPIPDMTRGDELPFPRHLPKRELPPLGVFSPTEDSIDENGHLNNAAYPHYAFAAAGLAETLPKTFCVDYRNEILPQNSVRVCGAWENESLLLSGVDDNKEYFRMKCTY